ncbi:MAG: dihydrolipoyl dehydrogenase [Bacteroidaceae bacterium]|nr:dihydrolipoyl dehydrogenase [Bacteroidaceae bacterium]
MEYDIVIIGAGPGGYETAVAAARKGLSVAVIEKSDLGGTCLNCGCIPTKCLCRTAEILELVKGSASHGIHANDLQFDFASAIQRKNQVVRQLQSGIDTLMKTPGITLYRGEAHLADANTVNVLVVGSNDTKEVADVIKTKNIIIATGSVTKFLPIEGAHAPGVVTSTEMLNLTTIPKRLCIIGGGVIGLEFASIYNSFGSEVTVVEFCKEILPNFDRDLAKRLRTSLKKRGMTFYTGAAAKSILSGDCMTVTYEEKGKEKTIDADLVLMAVGRTANVGSLNLDDLNIAYTPKGIEVDGNMQTSVPGIYAIGDVNGLLQLAHAAKAQGIIALEHILHGKTHKSALDLGIIPAAVFTVPEAAMVGKTEEQLMDSGVAYNVYKSFYRANGKALSMDAEDGIVKILASEDGQLLGAHILGAHASDLIHELAILMIKRGSVHDISNTVHAHPSLSEIILSATE